MIERIQIQKGSMISELWGNPITFGTTRQDNYILDSVDWGTARINPQTDVIANSDVHTVLGYSWETRQVVVDGIIVKNSAAEVNAAKNILKAQFRGGNPVRILYNGFTLEWYLTSDVSFAQEYERDNEYWCYFRLTGQCQDSRWKNLNIHSASDQTAIGLFSFPLSPTVDDPIVFGTHIAAGTLVYDYSGTVSTGMIVSIIAGQAASSLTITCGTQTMTITRAIYAGNQFRIDTRTGLQKVQEYFSNYGVWATITYDAEGDWLRLQPGHNIIQVDVPNSEVAIEVNTDDQYEVQTI